MTKQDASFIVPTQRWLEQIVIGLNLCPFAKREFVKNRINFVVCHSDLLDVLLKSLEQQLVSLANNSSIETTLLIVPNILQKFEDYNEFLDLADQLLFGLGYEGTIQIASFHPKYQFANTEPDDAENYTNRSPFPLIHLLREDSLEQAITAYTNPQQIPEDNIALMNKLGTEKLEQLIKHCLEEQ